MIRKDKQIIVHAKINIVWLFFQTYDWSSLFCGNNVIKETPNTWSIQQGQGDNANICSELSERRSYDHAKSNT